MNSYQSRWLLAVATKQAYPALNDAGAVDFSGFLNWRYLALVAGAAALGAGAGYVVNGPTGAKIGGAVGGVGMVGLSFSGALIGG